MKEFQELVINEIIHQLSPLRTLYQNDVNQITTDLLNHNYDSLNKFVATYYQDVLYTEPFQTFVKELVKSNLIDKRYLERMEISIPYTMITTETNYLYKDSTPLNVKENQKHELQVKYRQEIPNQVIKKEKPINNTETNEEVIKALKEKILEAQLLYLNDVNGFIEKLEQYEPDKIYEELMKLNDIRYIQHCIKNLSTETQNSLLTFIEQKLKVEHHSIDAFIEETIKKNIKRK